MKLQEVEQCVRYHWAVSCQRAGINTQMADEDDEDDKNGSCQRGG